MNRKSPLDPLEADLALPLAGRELSRCCVDNAVGLQFLGTKDQDHDITIRVAGRFLVGGRSSSHELELDPEQRGGLGPALELVGLRVVHAAARRSGELELGFDGGVSLRVPPDPQFEAWELTGPDGLLVVSTTGGLATWGTCGLPAG